MLVGSGAALSAVSFLGVLVIGPTLVVGGFMATKPAIRRSAFGLLSGAGLLLLYVAYVQRDGPGTTCWRTATGGGCDSHLNPLPWLVIGVVLVVGGVLGHARVTRTGEEVTVVT